MSGQFELYGVADTYQISEDILIPAGTIVQVKRLDSGPWVLRVDIIRYGDVEARVVLPGKLRDDLWASVRKERGLE